jgi:hypothetical protein
MNKTFPIPIDADVERKRALIKVYDLLLQLAETSGKKGLVPENPEMQTEVSTTEVSTETKLN